RDAVLRRREPVLERPPGEADGPRRGVDAGDVEAVQGGVEGAPRLRRRNLPEGADAVRGRHAEPFEPEVEGGEPEVPDLVDRPRAQPVGEPAALFLDAARAQAPCPA